MTVRPHEPDGKAVDYLGPEWAARALWIIQNDPAVRQGVEGSAISLRVLIEDAPPGRAGCLFVRFDGTGLAAWHFGDPPVPAELGEPDFTLRGLYAAFAEIQDGQSSGRKSFLSGRLRFDGGMLAAMRHMGALEAITDALARIPSRT